MENTLKNRKVNVENNKGTRINTSNIKKKKLKIDNLYVWVWREDVEEVFMVKLAYNVLQQHLLGEIMVYSNLYGG